MQPEIMTTRGLVLIAALVGASADSSWPWVPDSGQQSLGQHRALLQLPKDTSSTAAWVEVPWQRKSTPNASTTNAVLTVAKTGQVVANALRAPISGITECEAVNVIFEPQIVDDAVVTDYALYFMPYSWSGKATGLSYQASYDPINETASAAWRQDNGLSDAALASHSYKDRLPRATLAGFEAQTSFDSFEPMEIVAKDADRKALLAAHLDDILWFPEDRKSQVKMFDVIPQRWIEAGPSTAFQGAAEPGELFALQLGFWAARSGLVLDSSNVSWSALSDSSGEVVVPETNITCYNLGGRDYRGQEFSQAVRFDQGRVGALWFGISIPTDAAAGTLTGTLSVGQATFSVELSVSDKEPIINAGADDVWRMSRLSWLDSTIGIDRNITAGFDPVKYSIGDSSASVEISGHRSLVVSGSDAGEQIGLVHSISVSEIDVLSAPLSFVLQGLTLNAVSKPKVTQHDDMTVTFTQQTSSVDGSLALNSSIVVSYDGFIDVTLSLASLSNSDVVLENTQLSTAISPAASTFLMGLGLEGRNRTLMYPDGVNWNWNQNQGGENQVWVGAVDAGLRLKFKGDDYDWESPLHMQTVAPQSWAGDVGNGTVNALPLDDGSLGITVSSGAVTVHPEQPLTFKFDLLVTPVKTLNTALHFQRDRYYQFGYNGHGDCEEIAGMGTKVLNLHQGTDPNPYINYPFNEVAMEKQANFSQQCKSLGVEKTKIYYTTRELSNRCYEMPALMAVSSPQDHFFDDGTGGGPSWLQEHLGDGYHQRWSTGLPDGELDAAIADTSLTRWVNYYIEGLRWLSEDHPGTAAIDGLYLDEVSFDRATMQRMRKAVDERREGSLFDLHSCNKYHCGKPAPHACSALIYMAHFAFIDSLWFGEAFSPDSPPDQWLVEKSGIPFGLHAEQLKQPNLWRGMVFAEGARPAAELWAAWDSLELTRDGTHLIGWWDVAVPARSDHADIPVSVYSRPDGQGCVLAIASWAANSTEVNINIDWETLGLDAAGVSITAPAIKDFQPSATVSPQQPMITVDPGKGWLLDVRRKSLYV